MRAVEGHVAIPWQQRLAEYREAKARDDEAGRLMARAERTFDKLAKRMGDERAYVVAGVNFADERSVRASKDCQRALFALRDSLQGETVVNRLKAKGVVLCLNAPVAANDC